MKGRSIEVHTPAGDFLISEKDGRVICEGQGPDGFREFGHLAELPTEAKGPVFCAAQRLTIHDNRYITRGDQSTQNGHLNYDGFIHT